MHTPLRSAAALLLLLAGCDGGGTPAPEVAPPPGPVTPPQPPAVIAPVAADPPLAAGAASLCYASEAVRFACTVRGGKLVSLCAGTKDGAAYLRYRFGKVGQIELEYPDARHGAGVADDSARQFRYWSESHAQSQSLHVAFRSAEAEYDVWDQMTYGSERDHGAGILVRRHGEGPWGEGEEIAALLCDEDGVVTTVEDLAAAVPGR